MVKLKGLNPIKVSKKTDKLSFSYTIDKAGQIIDVPECNVEHLIKTGYFELLEGKKSSEAKQ